ncbi:MAG: phosphate signaling complex protein PhoU [Magnetococcales bacterium]|nr:phosphate signaling complex protein PhoU [Magnetococcales bacterium]
MSVYEKRLQQDLELIRAKVIQLGEEVEKALRDSMHALFNHDDILANQVILFDRVIGRQEKTTLRACLGAMARHLPTAGHLRFLMSIYRMVYELERIGDYAVTISREAINLTHVPEGLLRRELETMSANARTMLTQSLNAFRENDVGLAHGTMAMSKQMGMELDQSIEILVEVGDKHVEKTHDLLDLASVFYMLERVSDRAENICEEILFALTGEEKAEKVFNILFLDEDNSSLAPLAALTGSRIYPVSARFSFASRNPGATFNPHLVRWYTQQQGAEPKLERPNSLSSEELNGADLIISLEGTVRSYVPDIPFHAAFQDWNLGDAPDPGDESAARRRFEEVQRTLIIKLRGLMDILRGEEGV